MSDANLAAVITSRLYATLKLHPNATNPHSTAKWVSKVWLPSSIYARVLTPADLFQIIKENCPDAVKEGDIKNQFGRKVAIDA